MLIPRLVTLFVILVCAFGAYFLGGNFIELPQVWMRVLPVAVLSVCSLSGVVMLIGTFGMNMVDGHPVIDRHSKLGRFMNAIISDKRQGDLHCCDIYIDSTLSTVLGLGCLVILVGLAISTWVHIIGILKFVGIVCAIALVVYLCRNFIGRIWSELRRAHFARELARSTKRREKRFNPRREMVEALMWTMVLIAICLAAVGGFGLIVYQLFAGVMALGYTFWQALGYILVPLSLVTFPLWCILGKKLLLRTRFATQICPVVKR